MLSNAEQSILKVFQEYKIAPGEMLCFHGQNLQTQQAHLTRLAQKKLLFKERFEGGYSLTEAGFEAMIEHGETV